MIGKDINLEGFWIPEVLYIGTVDIMAWLWMRLFVVCTAGTNETEFVGFAGRLWALMDAFHVSSQSHFVEDFAAGANTSPKFPYCISQLRSQFKTIIIFL